MKPVSLYFLACPSVGLIKIGVSVLAANRIQGMAMWSPVPLETLAVIPVAARAVERQVHHQLQHLWSHFEWFHDAPELRVLLAAIKAGRADLQPVPTNWFLPHQQARGPKNPEARRAQTANAIAARRHYAQVRRTQRLAAGP